MVKIIIVASTNGGVISRLLESNFFRSRVLEVVSDRDCGAIEVAKRFQIKTKVYPTNSALEFSNFLARYYEYNENYFFVSFYTKLFKGIFLELTINRLMNLHPTILPSFPGLNGFDDSIKYGSKFIGSTIHFVNKGMDTGSPIIQSSRPLDSKVDITIARHFVFIQQCKMLLQVIKWIDEGRLKISAKGHAEIDSATYSDYEFSPALDFEEAKNFTA